MVSCILAGIRVLSMGEEKVERVLRALSVQLQLMKSTRPRRLINATIPHSLSLFVHESQYARTDIKIRNKTNQATTNNEFLCVCLFLKRLRQIRYSTRCYSLVLK